MAESYFVFSGSNVGGGRGLGLELQTALFISKKIMEKLIMEVFENQYWQMHLVAHSIHPL